MRLRPSLGCVQRMWKLRKHIQFYLSSLNCAGTVLVQGLCVTPADPFPGRVWQQIHDQAPTQAMNPSLSLCCHSRNQLLHLSAQEGNTDKDQSLLTGAKSDCIISNKKEDALVLDIFLFYICDISFVIISSLSLWILVFFFSVYWFVE